MRRRRRRWRGFGCLGSFDRELAALAFAGKVKTAVEEPGISQDELDFGGSRAVVSFPPSYEPPAAPVSTTSDTRGLKAGRVMVASLGADEFLVAGIDCRVQFAPPVHAGGKQMQLLRVEEGRYDGTTWVPSRLWNGDETDYGLNFGGKGSLLRVKLGSY